ncbi:triose-phosphate isomerase [candidate division KSB1 bacterium]|nr:triose-phosphate isomerase [candidate division KSB1 bacterium]
MFKTGAEAVELAQALRLNLRQMDQVDVIVCPPFTALVPAFEVCKGSPIRLGAQNMHWEDSGAFTGEIAAPMLLAAGCQYVIIGHSERRQYFAETNESINLKLKKAIAVGLTPIFCIGETLDERKSGVTENILQQQLVEGLKDFQAREVQKMVIAYEPVWAIGTGVTATPEQAQTAHAYIRQLLAQMYHQATAESIRIQYGGSLKPENANELLSQSDIDGGLIGGASLKADSFLQIIAIAQQLSR